LLPSYICFEVRIFELFDLFSTCRCCLQHHREHLGELQDSCFTGGGSPESQGLPAHLRNNTK